MAEDRDYISKVKLPSSNVYYLKDEEAQAAIASLASTHAADISALTQQISTITTNGLTFLGTTTDDLGANPTKNPIVINGQNITATAGSLVKYGNKEFLFDGTNWEELGDLTMLGALSSKNSVSGSTTVTPSGTISTPTFTGSSSNVNITVTDNNSGNYQPEGTISTIAFTGATSTFTGAYQPEGTLSSPTFNGNEFTLSTTYQPEGTISTPGFTGATSTFKGSYTPAGNITVTLSSSAGSTSYINEPTSKNVIGSITGVQPTSAAPNNNVTYCAVDNETLNLYYLQASPTASITTTSKIVKTGDITYSVSASSFSGTVATISVSGKPNGSVSQPNFTGTIATITLKGTPSGSVTAPSFTGTTATISVSGKPNGSVGQPVFTGTTVQIDGSVTPSGTISTPIFYGSPMTITIVSS